MSSRLVSKSVSRPLSLLVMLAAILALCGGHGLHGQAAVDERARRLHADALVVDTHMDTLQRVLMKHADLGIRSNDGQADLPRFKEGGVDAQFFAVWIDPMYAPNHAARRTLQLIDAMQGVIDRYPDRIELARSPADIRRIVGAGKLAALMGIEGGHAIQNDLALLRIYHLLGVSYMTLTHSNTNDWADSSTDKPRWGGLNELGRSVVREMNRVGMMVDISHVSDDTIRDVLEIATKPVIASHSSCRALCDHPRNLSDDLLRAIGQHDGYVGINFYPEFVDQTYLNAVRARQKDVLGELNRTTNLSPEQMDDMAAERAFSFGDSNGMPRPPFDRILDHIDHAVKVAGIDHVGIGSDLDTIPTPEGLDDVTDFPKITAGLLKRGYKDEDVRKILGGNLMRVFQQVVER